MSFKITNTPERQYSFSVNVKGWSMYAVDGFNEKRVSDGKGEYKQPLQTIVIHLLNLSRKERATGQLKNFCYLWTPKVWRHQDEDRRTIILDVKKALDSFTGELGLPSMDIRIPIKDKIRFAKNEILKTKKEIQEYQEKLTTLIVPCNAHDANWRDKRVTVHNGFAKIMIDQLSEEEKQAGRITVQLLWTDRKFSGWDATKETWSNRAINFKAELEEWESTKAAKEQAIENGKTYISSLENDLERLQGELAEVDESLMLPKKEKKIVPADSDSGSTSDTDSYQSDSDSE